MEKNIKKFGYAEITEGVFGTPKIVDKNLISGSITFEQSELKKYGDGKLAKVFKGNKITKLELTVYKVPKDYAIMALGYAETANGGLSDNGQYKDHCVFFMSEEVLEDGSTIDIIHYFYKAQASTPNEEFAQDEDQPTVKNLKISYICSRSELATDDNGEEIAYWSFARTANNEKLFDTYKSKIILPTDATPTVV